jgi:hypothetical protein
MLRFTHTQWRQLARDAFATRILAVLREAHPQVPLPRDRLAAEIARQVDRAGSHGLDDEHAAARYVYAGWLLGFDFDTRIPAVAQVLAAPLDASRKAAFLLDFARASFRALRRDPAGGVRS